MGNNYSIAPQVGFSSAPAGGTTAVGISSITDKYINCSGFSGTGKVQAVYMSNSGCGYTAAPWVAFEPPPTATGAGAAATTGLANGTIQSVTISNAGSGYLENPVINFPAPVGVGTSAIGIGYINGAGTITDIYLINAGAGYTSADLPLFADIESPVGLGSTVGIGTYKYNEVVIGTASSTTARVNRFISSELEISIISGTFIPGEGIYGTESNALYALQSQEVFDLVTPYADNDTIELVADDIISFSEINPFGMP